MADGTKRVVFASELVQPIVKTVTSPDVEEEPGEQDPIGDVGPQMDF